VVGGTETWLDSLCGILTTRGNDIVVAVAEGGIHNKATKLFDSSRHLKSGLILDGTSGSPAGCRHQIRRALRASQADVVVPVRVHDALVVCAAEKERGAFRVIYPLHECRAGYFQDLVDFQSSIDRVVVCDDLSRRAVNAVAGITEEKIDVIPQGIEIGPMRILEVCSGPLRIGYCGRLETFQKRSLDLVDICRGLMARGVDFRLCVAGAGPEETRLREALRDLISREIVRMDGWVERGKLLRDFYPCIDTLLLTSAFETGPIVAWEAMAAGAVLVTSRFRGLEAAGFLEHARNCLIFETGDIDGAVDRLAELAKRPDLAARLASEARVDVCRTRSLERVAERWEELFQQTIREPAKVGHCAVEARAPGASRLESLGLPIGVAEWVRRLSGRRFNHAHPGEEWPFHAVPEAELEEQLPSLLARLDYRTQ
jgi:glycosyltransferase involved in cell wall biosynthesis